MEGTYKEFLNGADTFEDREENLAQSMSESFYFVVAVACCHAECLYTWGQQPKSEPHQWRVVVKRIRQALNLSADFLLFLF